MPMTGYYHELQIPGMPVSSGEETPYTPTTETTKQLEERISLTLMEDTERFWTRLAGFLSAGWTQPCSSTITLTCVSSQATTTSTPLSPWHTSLPLGIAPIHGVRSTPALAPSGFAGTEPRFSLLRTDTRPGQPSYQVSWLHDDQPYGGPASLGTPIRSTSTAERKWQEKRAALWSKSTL